MPSPHPGLFKDAANRSWGDQLNIREEERMSSQNTRETVHMVNKNEQIRTVQKRLIEEISCEWLP